MSIHLCFRATIQITGINPYVSVSATRAAKIRAGWRRPLPVLIRINGKPRTPWSINMMPKGDGSFFLYLHGDVRKSAGCAVGDSVEVEVRFNPSYRNGPQGPMPIEFRRMLRQTPAARKKWEALSPSRQKEMLRYFSGLKSAQARARNLARARDVLAGSPGRFLGRDWN